MRANLFTLQNLLYLALILALLSSLGHVAYAFSTVNGNNLIEAYLSAVAIDVGLLALAAGINRRKSQQRKTFVLWLGVVLFSAISTYANWLAGVVHTQELSASVEGFSKWLVTLRPILLSAVLPALVIYLAEIATDNQEFEKQQSAKPRAKSLPAQSATTNATVDKMATTQIASIERKQERLKQLENLIAQNSQITNTELAEQLQVSESTIRNYKSQLNGRIAK